ILLTPQRREAAAPVTATGASLRADMPRVLIAEDDRVIANAMATHLRGAGMDVEWADNGDAALRKLRFERPDVAVIDLMLPGEDGWRITEALRAEGATIPIIMISARGSEHDKVHGLRIGADDYLAKPFGMRELVARVEAALRRSGMVPSERDSGRVEAPGLVVDADLHQALLDGEDAGLTRTEFRLLWVLAGESGKALTRDQLQQRVWGTPYRYRDRTVDVCVRKLRQKLDQRSATHTYIQTHPGVGRMNIAVLGTGTVGRTIATKLVELGHEVTMGSRTADNENAREWVAAAGGGAAQGTFADAASGAELVFNCTGGAVAVDALSAAEAENLAGKVVVDVSNPLDFSHGMPPRLTVCNTDSVGEQLQREFPDARIVKTLNTVNQAVMTDPASVPGNHTLFISGN